MTKAVLIVSVVLVLAAATSAWAQGLEAATPEPSAPRRDGGSLYRGAYEVTEDGALIYGGDVEVRCEDLVKFGAPSEADSDNATVRGTTVEPLTREAVELCAEAGFPPEGVAPNASPRVSGEPGALPETGGPALPPPVVGVAGIVVGGLLVLRSSAGILKG